MKYITLVASIVLLLGSQTLFGQDSGITGKVVDYETNRAIPGVTITEDFTANGTLSNVDGNFKLKIKGNNQVLELNFVGYYPLKFMNVPMKNEPIDFGEIKLVKNHLLTNSGAGVIERLSESDKEKDEKLRKEVFQKYRIKIEGKNLKPYFDGDKLVFDFGK